MIESPPRAPDVVVVERELFLEFRRRELFGEHRRDVQRPLRRDAVRDEAMDGFEQRQVTLECRFVEPVASVRPPSVIDHHRKMGMEDQ
jgi:hypothetical protein